MNAKQTFKIICISMILLSTNFYGQSIDQKAKSGANFICECSEKALKNNGVDTGKLKEIFDSYKSKGSLLSKYKTDVQKISSQLDSGYSAIETEIYKCRSQFRQKYRSDLSSKEFLSKMQTIINENAFIQGPQLIKTLNK